MYIYMYLDPMLGIFLYHMPEKIYYLHCLLSN